ncbi:MAG: lipopolysaccharide biosynthesis protein [Phycisphaerae bacterium]
MDQGKRLVINTISNVSALAVNATIGFLIAPYILSHLGKSTYGIWALTGSLLAYSSLLALGLNSAVNRWVPMYLVEQDFDGINRVVNTTLVAYLVGAGVLAAGVAVLTYGFPIWFHISPELYTASRLTVALVGAGFTILIALNVASAILSSVQRYDLTAGCDIFTDIARVIAIVIVFQCGFGLVAMATVAASSIVLRISLKCMFALRQCPQLRIDLSLARWQTLREMLAYSINTLMYSCGQIIQRQAALILIGAVLTTAAVTEYAMPLLVIGMAGQIVLSGSAAIKPAATNLDARDRLDQVQRLYLLGTKYALLIILPLTAFLLAYGGDTLRIWLKDDYMKSGPALLAILAAGAAFRLWHMPAFFVVVGLGKHRMFGLMTLLAAAMSVTFGLVLTLGFNLGVTGVAIGFAAPDLLIAVFLITPYCCRSVELTVWNELRSALVPAMLATAPFAVLLCVARSYYRPATLSGLLALVLVSSIPIGLGWWCGGLSAEDKLRFIRMIPIRALRQRRGI